MASATSRKSGLAATPSTAAAPTPRARIFGVSFRARKKLVNPAESQCSESSALRRGSTPGGQAPPARGGGGLSVGATQTRGAPARAGAPPPPPTPPPKPV